MTSRYGQPLSGVRPSVCVPREQMEQRGRLSPYELTVPDPEQTEWLSLQLTLDTVRMQNGYGTDLDTDLYYG